MTLVKSKLAGLFAEMRAAKLFKLAQQPAIRKVMESSARAKCRSQDDNATASTCSLKPELKTRAKSKVRSSPPEITVSVPGATEGSTRPTLFVDDLINTVEKAVEDIQPQSALKP